MSNRADLSIALATNILRHRLSRSVSVDVHILDPKTAFAPSDFNQHLGQAIGYFASRPNRTPMFILYCREAIHKAIDHVFVFYMGTNFKKVQPLERRMIARNLRGQVTYSVVNVVSAAPKWCDWSILLQAVEYTIHPNLIAHKNVRQVIEAHSGSKPVCFNASLSYPLCLGIFSRAKQLWQSMRSIGFRCEDLSDVMAKPRPFDILRIRHEKHCLYGIHYPEERSVLFLLPHACQFADEASYRATIADVSKCLSMPDSYYYGSTRYYGSSIDCFGVDILKACILCRLHPMTVVKECDIRAIVNDIHLTEMATKFCHSKSASVSPERPGESPVLVVDDDETDDDATEIITTSLSLVDSDGGTEVHSISSSAVSSQATIVSSQREIDGYVVMYNYAKFVGRRPSQEYPPVDNAIYPMDDSSGTYLRTLDHRRVFLALLKKSLDHWTPTTPYQLLPPVEIESMPPDNCDPIDLGRPGRFKVVPLFAPSKTYIVILDTREEEWAVMSAGNEYSKDNEDLHDFEYLVGKAIPFLRSRRILPITLTSSFHKDYPLIHLLMATFHLGRIFNHAQFLPSKVIYLEADFREFCYLICLRLQMANLDHNRDRNCIDQTGHLQAGAFVSYPSPVAFERSVVPTDQCPFCRKRQFKNLIRHIKMSHGGQSASANKARHS